jgi:hypothetical protein
VLKPNHLLKEAELLAKGKINGPEEVAVERPDREIQTALMPAPGLNPKIASEARITRD